MVRHQAANVLLVCMLEPCSQQGQLYTKLAHLSSRSQAQEKDALPARAASVCCLCTCNLVCICILFQDRNSTVLLHNMLECTTYACRASAAWLTCFWVTTPRSARRRPIRVLLPASTWPSTTRCSLVLPPAHPEHRHCSTVNSPYNSCWLHWAVREGNIRPPHLRGSGSTCSCRLCGFCLRKPCREVCLQAVLRVRSPPWRWLLLAWRIARFAIIP